MTTERSVRPDDPSDEGGSRPEGRETVPGPRVLRLVVRAVRAVEARTERLERAVERRWPLLYDLRHAASGIGRLVGPLIGAAFVLAILAPLLALLAALVGLLGLLGLDPFAVDLPDLPDVGVPGWLEAIGAFFGDVGGWIATASATLKWPVIVLLVVAGLLQSRTAVRRRAAAERIGRDELLRRLAVALADVERAARAREAAAIGDLARPPAPSTGSAPPPRPPSTSSAP